MGSAIFDLQYQNDPSGMGGNIFRREWFRHVERAPEGQRRIGIDLAISAGQRSDYTTAVEFIEDTDMNLYVVGAWRERLTEHHRQWLTGVGDDGLPIMDGPLAEAVARGPRLLWPMSILPAGFASCYESYPVPRLVSALNIEAVTFQVSFVRELLRMTRLPAVPVYPDKDKVARARTLAVRYEQGKVFHVRGKGVVELEAEMVAFPNSEHDDLVEAAVYGAAVGDTSADFSFATGKWG